MFDEVTSWFLARSVQDCDESGFDRISSGRSRWRRVRRRAWTLFLLLPRLLLFRPARGGLLPKGQLQERFNRFTHGEWLLLLTESRDNTERAMQTQRRRRRTQQDTVERRVQRAEALVHLGELSSGRQALEGAALAPATSKLVAPELHSQRTSSSISPQFLSS